MVICLLQIGMGECLAEGEQLFPDPGGREAPATQGVDRNLPASLQRDRAQAYAGCYISL